MSEFKMDPTSTTVTVNVGKHSSNETESGDFIPITKRLQNNQNLIIDEKCNLQTGVGDTERAVSVEDGLVSNNEDGSGDYVPVTNPLPNNQNLIETKVVDSEATSSEGDVDELDITVIDQQADIITPNKNGSADYVRLQNNQNHIETEVVDSERTPLVGDTPANNNELDTTTAADLQTDALSLCKENGSGDYVRLQNILTLSVEDEHANNNEQDITAASDQHQATISPTYVPTELSLVVPKLDKKVLLIPKISSNLQNNALAVITAALVANNVEFQSANEEVILSLYCGVYNLYLKFIDNPVIAHYLLRIGYKVREVTIEEWTSWIALKRKGVCQIVAHYLGQTEDSLVRLAWTLMAPLLCLLGHRPNQSNILYWSAKVLQTISIATELPTELLQTLFYPSLNFCQALIHVFDKLFELKRQLFITVYNTASLIPAIPGTVCRLVVELLRGVGMLDFILIDHFLLIQNPFSLLLNALTKHTAVMLKAYEKFMDYGNLAPWFAIVAPPEDLKVFHDPGVKFVAAVARGLAFKQGLSLLENYHPTKETQEIIDTVEKAHKLSENMRARKINQEKKDEIPAENV